MARLLWVEGTLPAFYLKPGLSPAGFWKLQFVTAFLHNALKEPGIVLFPRAKLVLRCVIEQHERRRQMAYKLYTYRLKAEIVVLVGVDEDAGETLENELEALECLMDGQIKSDMRSFELDPCFRSHLEIAEQPLPEPTVEEVR